MQMPVKAHVQPSVRNNLCFIWIPVGEAPSKRMLFVYNSIAEKTFSVHQILYLEVFSMLMQPPAMDPAWPHPVREPLPVRLPPDRTTAVCFAYSAETAG